MGKGNDEEDSYGIACKGAGPRDRTAFRVRLGYWEGEVQHVLDKNINQYRLELVTEG